MAESISNYTFNYTNRGIYLPLIQVLLDFVSANKLGVKTGEGFYSYLDTSSTNTNAMGMLTESEKTELLNFLDSTLQQSVKTWSHRSGIPFHQLSLAMNEYLGMELNWEE
jgi:3-hydroxyacyl-CoA dehydrogenase